MFNILTLQIRLNCTAHKYKYIYIYLALIHKLIYNNNTEK